MFKKKLNKDYLNILTYLIRFLVISIPIIFINELNFFYLQKFFAIINLFLFNLIGISFEFFYSFSANGLVPSLFFENKIIRIDSACTGIRSFYFLFSLIFAHKESFKKKIKFLILGLFAIFFVNIVRIFISSFLFIFNFNNFDSFIWATSLNFTALIVFYFFLKNN